MRKERRNLLYQLDDLIQKLSKRDRQLFKWYIQRASGSKKRESLNYVALFDFYCVNKRKGLDKIEEKTNLTDSELISAAKHLRKLIFESLVFFESNMISGLFVARKAKEKGFVKYAVTLLHHEIEIASENEELEYLTMCLGELNSIKSFLPTKNSPQMKVPEYSVYLKQYSNFIEIRSVTLLIQKGIKSNFGERKSLFNSLKEKVQTLKTPSPYIRIEVSYVRLLALWNTLGFENQESKRYQSRVVELMNSKPLLFSPEEFLREMRLLILLHLNFGENDKALELLTDLASRDYPEYMEEQVLELWLINSLILAAITNDESLRRRALSDFEQNEGTISYKWKFSAFHSASLLYFIDNDFHSCIQWQNKLNKLPAEIKKGREWVPYLVRGICFFEQGYFAKGEKSLRVLQERSSDQYANHASNLIMGYFTLKDQGAATQLFLQEAAKKFKEMKDSDEFGYSIHFFDITVWLESKIRNRSLSELFSDESAHLPSLFRVSTAS